MIVAEGAAAASFSFARSYFIRNTAHCGGGHFNSGKAKGGWLASPFQYGLQTASSIRPVVVIAVGELLWLPSASTPSFWLARLGLIKLLPADALGQEGSIRVGERSPPATMENWYDPEDVP